MSEKLRLLPMIASDGATQMSLDEALLDAAAVPTLRVYEWTRPTVSLGYFQDFDGVAGTLPPGEPPQIVRRITGGGAIWHEHEVTYCLVGTLGTCGFPGDTRSLYAALHGEVLAELARRGAALSLQRDAAGDRRYREEPRCFASPAVNDLIAAAGGKSLGSAARVRGERVLVHGSLKLASNRWDERAVAACGVTRDEAAAALVAGIARALGAAPESDSVTNAEAAARDRIRAARYGSDAWVVRRIGPRP
jgi:lipoate-protein ligase A